MSANIKSDDDCYFFFNATCTKGDACPFRHSNAAYGSDAVCSFWREGKCIKGASCKYRHMELRIKQRNKVECFFERQPGGCKKPHCPFLHKSPSKITNADGTEILSEIVDSHSASSEHLVSAKTSSSVLDQESKGEGDLSSGSLSNVNENFKSCSSPPFSPTSKQPGSPSSTAATIGSEPVSFNIDIAEESENEPEEINNIEKKSAKLTNPNHQSGKNFGVKTLEQIRMEKVFKSNDVNKESLSEPTNTSNKVSRIKLKRKTLCSTNNSNTVNDNLQGTQTSHENESKSVCLGFGIKSLKEIRREKEQAEKANEKTSVGSETDDAKPKKVIKIKRTHLGISKPSEPPSKIVKIRKSVDDSSVPDKPLNKCNLTQSTDKPTKVQSPEQLNQQQSEQKQLTLTLSPSPLKNIPSTSLSPKSGLVSPSVSLSSTSSVAILPPKSPVDKPSSKTEIKKIAKNVPKQLIDTQKKKQTLSGQTDPQTQQLEHNSFLNKSHKDRKKLSPDLLCSTRGNQISKKSKRSTSPSHDGPKSNKKLSGKEATEDFANLLSKDDDLLVDDLLADENEDTAPDDVNIEDEDDEFLKEIEHVINS